MNPLLLFLILLFPLAAAVVNALFGARLPRRAVVGTAVGGVALSALASLVLWPLAEGEGTRATLYTWLESGAVSVPVEIVYDRISAPMALMVTSVATLIHLYAAGYMEEEKDYARFFALLNLFVFAMLVIVMADNLLLLFLGWEGVGFCSYGLIGFWYFEEQNADAGRKAFLVTRVGDVFLGIALLWLFALTGTLSISQINEAAPGFPPETLFLLSLLLLGGACGKSAQLPFMTWLPDAMAGPTPVSALIHAATMVTAGVYLLCRLFPLVSLSSGAMATIALVGAATALYAATCAAAQREIKRVLAYSTMSQVGFMFMAVGIGSVSAALFHLFTHAFFKALLFMGAGCVIHMTAGENDIYRMGGLARRDRLLFWTFLIGALCLAGAPLTGGFFSKDGILVTAFASDVPLNRLLWGVGSFIALFTSFYTFRLVYLVFLGAERRPEGAHIHHLPTVMRWTLVPLAVFALFGGLFDLPPLYGGGHALREWLGPMAGAGPHLPHAVEWILAGVATFIFLLGWGLAHRRYRIAPVPGESLGTRFFLSGWWADRTVHQVIVRPFGALGRFFWNYGDGRLIDGSLDTLARGSHVMGEGLRRFTTGRLHSYVTALGWGGVVILVWFLAAYLF
jgi:NADH-quinone oxidoreductase subunit L